MSKNYYRNSIFFRRQIYKLRAFLENGELNLEEEKVKVINNFFDGALVALSMYEKPISKKEAARNFILIK